MSKAAPLGRAEVTIEELSLSGCGAYVALLVLVVAGYLFWNYWVAVLFICACAGLVLIVYLWNHKMKFYERGLTLHGLGAPGTPRLLYIDLEHVHITEKHLLTEERGVYGLPTRYVPKRDLLDVALDALFAKKSEKKPEPPKFYENTEYTFRFTLKEAKEPVTFSIILDRADEEIPSIAERLEMEGVKVVREEARARPGGAQNAGAA